MAVVGRIYAGAPQSRDLGRLIEIVDSMARNIEIKARSSDVELQKCIAARLTDGPSVLIKQEDTFFHVPRGRLKLREFGDGTGELIEYDRPDLPGPKQSTYTRSPTSEPLSLKATLAAVNGHLK